MLKTPAYAALAPGKPFVPFTVERREPGPREVLIDILFCGVCHSDIHQARDEGGGSTFPMVPGHQIVGRVAKAAGGVKRHRAGDLVGLGGLGQSAVKLAASMGAEVTVLSTSKSTEKDAKRLGAHAFESTKDEPTFDKLKGRFDIIIDTISAPHDYNRYLGMVRIGGAMVVVGVPPEATPVHAFSLIQGNKKLAGSLIGG